MRTEGHVSVRAAEVRGRELARHGARRCESGRAWIVGTALGMPRTWSYARDAVFDGFERGVSGPHRGLARLEAALAAARTSLVERVNVLVEHEVPDVGVVALVLDAGELHVAVAGAGRAYVHRRGQPERLTPRDTPDAGLIDGDRQVRSLLLDPGDLVFAGSATAFSTRAIGRVVSVLEKDPRTPPSVLATLLTDPAAKAGVGAAAVVLRAT